MKEKVLLDGRENEKERLFKSQLRVLEESDISPENRKKIKDFIRDKQLIGVHNSSITPYLYALTRLLAHIKKDLGKISDLDLKNYFVKMQNTNSETGNPFSETTIHNHKRSLKFFYKWHNGGTYPKCVEWVKELGHAKTKLSEDMLTEEDIEELVKHTNNTRDQAIISVLYDSAARAGEFCNVRLKDVKFDQLGALMRVDGKTGERKIRLINSMPYIQAWIQVHPLRDDPNAFLWHNMQAHKWAEVNRQTLARILNRAAKKAKLKKRIHPHVFRHSRLTALAPKVTEQVLKSFAGWSPDSRMAAIYVHMSGKNLDLALAKAHGVQIEEEAQENKLAPKSCPRCKTKNTSTAKYCATCSMALDLETALEHHEHQKKDDLTVKTMMERMHKMQKSMEQMFEEMEEMKKENATAVAK
ncbi:MAG TPA: tyrosine-type recombinase/integrase [archaeon]|nr:tyrosine-type recombinase/integrase [archaeon]